MLAALDSLDAELRTKGSRLYMFFGETASVVAKLIAATSASVVASNANYTPYALDRDRRIEMIVEKANHPEKECTFILTEEERLRSINILYGNAEVKNSELFYQKKYS
jgi:deoxyribodipyrimidine photolyase